MTRYVALLRAVNVGGTGRLPMRDLAGLCEAAGFANPRTYIASGNVVFDSDADEAGVKVAIETALAEYAGKRVGVMVRTGAELSAILEANPFRSAEPNHVAVIFLDARPPADWKDGVKGLADEDTAAGAREFYVHYPRGQGQSKFRIAAAREGTARNVNTVAKLAEMCSPALPN